jgi:hypothetical protein
MSVWKFGAAPRKRLKHHGGKADRATYDACHLAWRAGLIDDWYHGARSPQDSTIVWELNGTERARADIDAELERVKRNAGVASIVFGDEWMGYRAVVVSYVDGSRVCEQWNGHEVEVVAA